MNIVLWVLQVLLAIAFAGHSYLMLRPSPQQLQAGMKYVLELPAGLRIGGLCVRVQLPAAAPQTGRVDPRIAAG